MMAYVRRCTHRRCPGRQVPLRALERYGVIAVHNMLLMLMLIIIFVMCRFMCRRRVFAGTALGGSQLLSDPSQTALEHYDGRLLCLWRPSLSLRRCKVVD